MPLTKREFPTPIPPKKAENMTIGHLREIIAELPDNMPIKPEWFEVPSDSEPAVCIEGFDVVNIWENVRKGRKPRKMLAIAVRLVPLDSDEWQDEDDEDDEEAD